jgi:CheY-like chemotaxis protein
VFPPETPNIPARRALVVEDDPNIRQLLERVLVEAGLLVLTASDGESAIEKLRAFGRFDVMTTDHSMPGMDGLALVLKVLAIAPATPIVVCSGSVTPEIKRKYLACGAKAVLEKPFRPDKLAAAVLAAMG